MACDATGKFRYFYTGNQVGDFNFCGDFNFVAGGLPGQNISSGTIAALFFPFEQSRFPYLGEDKVLDQPTLNTSFPFMDLKWIADIEISTTQTLRVSNRNIYVEDAEGKPRFYEARAKRAPRINVTVGEWLAPNFEIGDLKITLNNRDGYFNQFLAHGESYTQWLGKRVSVKIGFGEKLSNYHEVFTGFIAVKKGITTTDEDISISAYDKFDNDEVPIPPQTFDETNYPNVEKEFVGKPVPLVYGDWQEEVGDFGEIPAICANARDDLTTFFIWKISQNSIREIGEVYLHRGERVEGRDGPIRVLDNAITKDPENSRIIIDSNQQSLSEAYAILKDKRAAVGSGLNLIISASPDLDFVAAGVREGNLVYKDADNVPAVVDSVSPGQIVLTGGKTFADGDQYSVLTDKYFYLDGDRVSVKLKGKDITTMSKFRLAEAGVLDSEAFGVSITFENTFWTADDSIRKIQHISLSDFQVLEEIEYDDIDPAITNITGISYQSDNTLWLFDNGQSKVYRWLVDDKRVGLDFDTLFVSGLVTTLTKGVGLTIDKFNYLHIADNATGEIYTIDPFFGLGPKLLSSFNISAFEPLATEINDMSYDNNAENLVIIERQTLKVYRVDAAGALIPDTGFSLIDDVSEGFTFPTGVSVSQDGTLYLLNRSDQTLYNFNEFDGASENAGFIARDLLQNYAGKNSGEFDLVWNETCRESLSRMKARAYINELTNVISYVNKFMQQTNTVVYNRFQKYALFHISFENFRNDGDLIREGDIEYNSFKPTKEYNQYFNSAVADYQISPFSSRTIESDTYISPLAITLSGREVKRRLELPNLYRREDIDYMVPLFVRLAAAEPEFVEMKLSLRFLFTQISDFFRINFYDYLCAEVDERGNYTSGRRFENIPCFIRKMQFDLDKASVDVKVWSLGTTAFGDFTPTGEIAGGQFDDIILTNLGTPGYITPNGNITGFGTNFVQVADVDGVDAFNRADPVTGKAWAVGYKIGIYDGTTRELLETLTISDVVGNQITFEEDIQTALSNTVLNSAGFIESGNYIGYTTYQQTVVGQRVKYCYYGPPQEGYPYTPTEEVEEQRAGKHNFIDERLPYLLHPLNYVANNFD